MTASGRAAGPTQQPPIGLAYMPLVLAMGTAVGWFVVCTVGAFAASGGAWRPHNLRELLDYTTSMFDPSPSLRSQGLNGPWGGIVTITVTVLLTMLLLWVAARRMRNVAARRRGLAQRSDLERMSADTHLAKAHVYRPGSRAVTSPFATG
ncbi:MAG: hypothetical protein ABMA25_25905, partial [Ilumatobacteraceae bacterium]